MIVTDCFAAAAEVVHVDGPEGALARNKASRVRRGYRTRVEIIREPRGLAVRLARWALEGVGSGDAGIDLDKRRVVTLENEVRVAV